MPYYNRATARRPYYKLIGALPSTGVYIQLLVSRCRSNGWLFISTGVSPHTKRYPFLSQKTTRFHSISLLSAPPRAFPKPYIFSSDLYALYRPLALAATALFFPVSTPSNNFRSFILTFVSFFWPPQAAPSSLISSISRAQADILYRCNIYSCYCMLKGFEVDSSS